MQEDAAEKMDELLKPIDVSGELKHLSESSPQYPLEIQSNNQYERKTG
jgi:hypothetical protein